MKLAGTDADLGVVVSGGKKERNPTAPSPSVTRIRQGSWLGTRGARSLPSMRQ